jgi:hypothetical protein
MGSEPGLLMSGTLKPEHTHTPKRTSQPFHFPFIFQLRTVGNLLSAADSSV